VGFQPEVLDLVDAGLTRALGSTEIKRADVRIIATTSSDLSIALRQRDGRFTARLLAQGGHHVH
jgi:DNA-binding NtrC family response regulator